MKPITKRLQLGCEFRPGDTDDNAKQQGDHDLSEQGFHEIWHALLHGGQSYGWARDDVALALARAWTRLDADHLTFAAAASTIIEVSDRIGPAVVASFEENFRWREIL